MAARLLLLRTTETNRTYQSILHNLIPNLPSPPLFSTRCRKSEHFSSPPAPHLLSPPAKKVLSKATAHGVDWQDPYRWMSNINDPDFTNYLNDENSYAEAFMRDTEEIQRTLYTEMVSRLPASISTPPQRWGSWLYYQSVPEGKEYPVLCRKLSVEKKGWVYRVLDRFRGFGKEQVMLDLNEIAEKHGYVHVGTCKVSPDHNFLAYTLDTTGSEQFKLQIKDLRSNTILSRPRVEGVVSLAWAEDSNTLFYTTVDQNQRPNRVLCTKVGSNYEDDSTIFTENDSRFCLDITSMKDGKFVTVYIIDATNPQSRLQKFCKRASGVQYFLEHHDNFFYVLTNAPRSTHTNSSNNGYYIAMCGDEDANSDKLKNIIAPGEGICLEDMDIFRGHLVLFLNRAGFHSICSINIPTNFENEKEMLIDDLNPWYFPLPSTLCTLTPGSNHDFNNTVFRAVLSSPVTPDLIVDYDMSRESFCVVQQDDVRNVLHSDTIDYISTYDHDAKKQVDTSYNEKGVYDNGDCKLKDFSEKYAFEVKEVVSHDGVNIPLTILFSRSAYRKGQSPALLHGYGAYGENLDKSWYPDRLSLLDRGWMFAFSDVRGGAGPDPSWHESGRGLNKLNSIQDFIACGEYLINEGLIDKNKLAAVGTSAGCVLVGAAINMQPELFRAVILKAPFLDVLNTLLDPNLPLTTMDYEEFGNPQVKSYFEHIRKYSPYDNILPGLCCPSMLVSASLNDSRVGVWEAAKWVAKIRDISCPDCSSSVILKTDMAGGHFGEGGRYAHCLETAYEYAFLMKAIETRNRT
ncbi:uncharacterized protein LOC127261771 isoform X2 [Andrographis paniculata]|uniref:uncharacterized protein LOC127261771 isoform X2 n=1 Tax=Andrographis paniculata TaxID=175694 RepID=UPI0021E881C0|nr:uncharacterized protein LOC127261771 isoform X2 [Andrographis paniculata]